MGACASSNAIPISIVGNGPREVHITLERNGTIPLGLRLTRDRHGIVARGVDEGSTMQRWNSQHPSMEVGRGDRLVSVNGVAVDNTWNGWCNILAEFRKQTVTVVVARNANRPRRQGPLEPSVALDHLLPDGFLDGLPRNLKNACNCGDECSICLEELNEGSDVVVLPCRHAFHYGCAERWLTQCPTFRYARCPFCRTQIPFDLGAKSATPTVCGECESPAAVADSSPGASDAPEADGVFDIGEEGTPSSIPAQFVHEASELRISL